MKLPEEFLEEFSKVIYLLFLKKLQQKLSQDFKKTFLDNVLNNADSIYESNPERISRGMLK